MFSHHDDMRVSTFAISFAEDDTGTREEKASEKKELTLLEKVEILRNELGLEVHGYEAQNQDIHAFVEQAIT